jgi:DNA-directed RNA polymerase specialized sigma24 family protein
LDDLIDVSGLTAFQEIVFRLRFAGMKIKDIARDLDLAPSRTALALKNARRKVRAAYEEGRYAGWYEVYLSEVNRTTKK